MLVDQEIVTRNFYGINENQDDSRFEVYALGPGFVLVDGQVIDSWEGHLPRLLFFFALDRPVVTRSEICQAFWPVLDSDQAVNVFHVTKRRLHKALDTDVLIHGEGHYHINPEMTIYYDAMDFVTSLIAARDEGNPGRIDAWQRVIDLYRGPFLQGHDDAWILDRRRDFRIGYLEAMTAMAKVWYDRGRHDQSLSLLLRALDEDYSREDIHRDLMQLYTSVGRRSEAAAHYQQFADHLKARGLEPAPDTQTLYAEIIA